MKNKQAFTLIELLVVVLIIGILAAVALPQYQRAVEKSRATQAFTIVKSLAEAQERYFLANGEYATSFDSFDIEIPGTDAIYNGYARKKTDYFDFGLNTASSRPFIAMAQRWEKGKVHVDGKGHYAFVKLANDSNIYCILSSGGLGDPWQICKTLSGGQLSPTYSGWYIIRL